MKVTTYSMYHLKICGQVHSIAGSTLSIEEPGAHHWIWLTCKSTFIFNSLEKVHPHSVLIGWNRREMILVLAALGTPGVSIYQSKAYSDLNLFQVPHVYSQGTSSVLCWWWLNICIYTCVCMYVFECLHYQYLYARTTHEWVYDWKGRNIMCFRAVWKLKWWGINGWLALVKSGFGIGEQIILLKVLEPSFHHVLWC